MHFFQFRNKYDNVVATVVSWLVIFFYKMDGGNVSGAMEGGFNASAIQNFIVQVKFRKSIEEKISVS